jgi:hypothetical protein
MKNSQSQIQSSEFRIQNSKFETQNSKKNSQFIAGVVGVAVKPVAGVMDLATKTTGNYYMLVIFTYSFLLILFLAKLFID